MEEQHRSTRLSRWVADSEQPLLWSSIALFLLCYLLSLCVSAARTPFWMDEILSIWAARMGSIRQIYSAVARGSEFSPPALPILLHFWIRIAGQGTVALRIPSIAASLLTAACAFYLFRRCLGGTPALFGVCLLLEEMRPFTLQARQYIFVTACFALVLVLWDSLSRRPSLLRYFAIGLLLATAISFHFYSVLLVPCLGLIELLTALKTRRWRIGVWITLFFSGASIMLWYPLMHAIRQFNAGDVNSPQYYAKPRVVLLLVDMYTLFLSDRWLVLLVLSIMALIVSSDFLGRRPERPEDPQSSPQPEFWAMTLGLIAYPAIVFLFARFVSRTLTFRYLLPSTIGISAMFAYCLRFRSSARLFAPALVLLASFFTLAHLIDVRYQVDKYGELAQLPGPYPIVIANGLDWFPILEQSPQAVRSRIVYLVLPPGVPMGDPTNEHQIQRWKAIDPSLAVEGVEQFLSGNSRFYVIDYPGSDGTLVQFLKQRRLIRPMETPSEKPPATIFQSAALANSDRW